MAFCKFLSVNAGLDAISSKMCSFEEAKVGWYVVTEQDAFFFRSLLLCSKGQLRSADLTLRGNFFNEIVRLTFSMKMCELTHKNSFF